MVRGHERRWRRLLGLITFGGALLWLSSQSEPEVITSWLAKWWPAVVVGLVLLRLPTFVVPTASLRSRSLGPIVAVLVATLTLMLAALAVTTGVADGWDPQAVLPITAVGVGSWLVLFGPPEGAAIDERATAWLCRRALRSNAPLLRRVHLTAVSAILDVDLTEVELRGDSRIELTTFASLIRIRLPEGWSPSDVMPAGRSVRVRSLPKFEKPASAVQISCLGAWSTVEFYCVVPAKDVTADVDTPVHQAVESPPAH
jgi:hypothetical protein